MAPVFRQVAPDQLEFREGGGCLSLFGLPFLCAGVFILGIGLGLVPLANASDVPGWAYPILCVFGLVFTAVGAALVFGRRWSVLDTGQGRVVRRWGLLVPFKQEAHSLRDYDAVVLRFKSGDSDSADVYPVGLRRRAGEDDLPVQSFTVFGEAHEAARVIARFLRLPLVDAATAHEVVTAADRLADSLPDRLRRENTSELDAPRPLRMRCKVTEASDTVEIVIPAPPFNAISLAGLALPLAILAYIGPSVAEFFSRTRTPPGIAGVFLGALVLFLGIAPALRVVSAVRKSLVGETTVRVTRQGIHLVVRNAWSSRQTRLPIADIFGIDYATTAAEMAGATANVQQRYSAQFGRSASIGNSTVARWLTVIQKWVPSKGIIIKSRTGLVTFGAGLADDEIRYLYAAVVRVLRNTGTTNW